MKPLVLLATCLLIGAGSTAQASCTVEPFRGATSPQGALAQVRMVNRATPCALTNYGVPAERRHPAQSATITRSPANGAVEFVAPEIRYLPNPGFTGDDEFEYQALARGNQDQPVTLRVRVKVTVVAP